MEFGNQVLDTIIRYIKKGLNIKKIMIPTNCSFLMEDKLRSLMNNYFEIFNDLGVDFSISASIDGLFIDTKSRPFKNKQQTAVIKNKEYYDNIISFLIEHDCGFHPMISAYSIEHQKDNYKWWFETLQNHLGHPLTPDEWHKYIMMLEVRNNDWTTEKIISYLDWLNYAIDFDIKNLWSGNTLDFIYYILLRKNGVISKLDNTPYKPITQFDSTNLCYSPKPLDGITDKGFTCSVGSSLIVRLGDLSIVPCHRTSYKKFIYGQFKVENDKIVGLTANNPFLMFNILFQGTTTMFKCDHCAIKNCCIKGCIGSQFESTEELFYPIESVCNFYKAKVVFQHLKYLKLISDNKFDNDYVFPTTAVDEAYEKLLKDEPEETNRWVQIIQTIIS